MNLYITRSYTIEGEGYTIQGHEEDCVLFLKSNPNEDTSFGISDILKHLGVDPIGWYMQHYFENEGIKNDWEDLETRKNQYIKQYREQTREKFPALYKIKISVQAEKLSDEEANKFWLNRQEQIKKFAQDEENETKNVVDKLLDNKEIE